MSRATIRAANSTAAAVRTNDNEQNPTNITNASTGLVRPLFTSCYEHPHNPANPQQSKFLCLNELPRMPSPSHSRSPARRVAQDGEHPSPFLRLPPEIRLQIYSLLVLPREAKDLLPSFERVHSSCQDYFDYDKKLFGTELPATANLSHPTILIRTLDPERYRRRYADVTQASCPGEKTFGLPVPLRSKYSVRCDRFRSACKRTTYHCVNVPRIEDHLAILRTNQQIHAECADLLYGSYTFDFDTHVEAIVPFLSDLTPYARSCVKSVRFVKRALAYEKEFDRCEWSNALRYLTASSSGISLRKLDLGIVAGRPGENGWDRIARYSADYFRHSRDDGEGMEWLQYLLELQGLEELEVRAVVEHCPPSTNSAAMARYVRFSASVEGGFAEFLKEQLLVSVQA